MIQLLPTGARVDPITDTWLRGLIATALAQGLRPLCWHIDLEERGSTATGYVTLTLQSQADRIRESWALHLGLDFDHANGYLGSSGGLVIALPDAIDPDEHCRLCHRPFDPYDPSPAGRARNNSGDVCRACAVQ